ncbi:hypothetical protein Taro_027558 [Colocasia esculenta]|uniref:non-specific serine/threonine protein kinase n=1 Tax=Colocasia esculenta TaxID=4460 RepID=A0A843VIE7_COLES|nr:hypothetical protein [Colocasia esculenta]
MATAAAPAGTPKPTVFFFISLSICFASLAGAVSFSFNFSGDNQSRLGACSPEALVVCNQGEAFQNKDGIQLTRNEYGVSIASSHGRAVLAQPILLWDSATRRLTDFTTHFSFKIDALNMSRYGDGLAFFLSPYPSVLPDNSTGAWLGLFAPDKAFNVSANSIVAVEFDSFNNVDWDPGSDHIGIDINSIVSKATLVWRNGIKRGDVANAWVAYNATTHNLSVFLTYDKNPAFRGRYNLSFQVDLREVLPEQVAVGFSASTGQSVEKHTLLSWSFNSTLDVEKKKDKSSRARKVTVGVTMAVICFVVAVLLYFFLIRRARRASEEEDEYMGDDATIEEELADGRGPKKLPYRELVAATNNFAEEGKLGEGGFGSVYKGRLGVPRMEVAIKRISRSSRQGKKEYISEVKIISRLRHRNLVQLIGWCHGRGQFLLVYEFMSNGSLDAHLFGAGRGLLPWPARYKIAQGLAAALLYLHEEWEQCVVHRDVKSSNVMLDAYFNAKLGDFGLAKLIDHERGSQTTVLAGTMGYMAPEYATTGRASKESDVYSYGVVVLEIACGRRAVEPRAAEGKVSLLEWVWGLHGRRMLLEAADERLRSELDEHVEQEMQRLMIVGLWCAHPDHTRRPTMRQAASVLSLESPPPALPGKMPVPVYFAPSMDGTAHLFSYSTSSAASGPTVSGGFSPSSSRMGASTPDSLLMEPRASTH